MNVEAIREDWAGRVLDGRFTLLEWLGGTARGGVFLTEMPGSPEQKAAIKLAPAGAETQLAGWAAAVSLSHPHLMRLLGTGRCTMDGEPLIYNVQEYAAEVLAEILPERALTADETREMLGTVIDTLAWLHAQGFVHGHLKPSNVLVVNDQLKLSSDGLYRAGEARTDSATESVYNAPETLAGPMTPAADVWSLGALLVETLTQRRPLWDGAGEPASPATLPQPFAGIARSCLQVDPVERCTLDEIKGWLRPAEARTVAVAAPLAPTAKRQALETKVPAAKARGGLPVAALIGVAVVVIGVAGLLYMRPHGSETSSPGEAQQGLTASGEAKPAAGTHAGTRAQEPAPEAASPEVQEPTTAVQPAMAQSPETEGAQETAAAGAVSQRVMPAILPAAQASIQGRVNVRIRVMVDAAGNVADAAVESQGTSRYFAKAAQDAARQWKFRPAQAGGQRVWVLAFEFTRAGTEVTPLAVR